jgi:hypothetical protein
MLKLLDEKWPPKRQFLGGGIGLALVLTAAAFALIHLPCYGNASGLATFFPADLRLDALGDRINPRVDGDPQLIERPSRTARPDRALKDPIEVEPLHRLAISNA